MEHQREKNDSVYHVIDMPESGGVQSSESSAENPPCLPHQEVARVRNDQAPVVHTSSSDSTRSNIESSASIYKVLTSIKLTYKMSIIFTSVIVLVVSRHEKPQNPLFTWVVGYIVGCAASVPIIFRHYFLPHPRLFRLVDRFSWLLELFFALWFVVGNYWVFGEKNSSEAHNIYSLSIALLVLNYIKYIGPSIICAIILCCCRGLLYQIGGAPTESIEALPTYKFKLYRHESSNGRETEEKMHECGVVAEGTEKERALLTEDAVCCICLANYEDNDELKELPCSHLFHASCVDKWLKIKASCPLCKCMLQKSNEETPTGARINQES